MPNSYTYFKEEVREWFKNNVPANTKVLDVGPGQGTYGKLLFELGYNIDAIEVWRPYITEYKLWEYYGNIHNADIREFDWSEYEFIILGDVLEHLTSEEGQKLITDIARARKQCLVAIPYMMEQDGEEYGNIYETHLQPDLTKEVMAERYPTLDLLYANEYYGYYVSKKVVDKAFVLYATEAYYDIVTACVNSITAFSQYPVFVYMLNSDKKVPRATTIRWNCNIDPIEYNTKDQFYINRTDDRIYNILIQRPLIVIDCLKYADTVMYVDSDSVATPIVDRVFNYSVSEYPLFTSSIYDQMFLNGKGDLEKPICNLLNIQRGKYIQTGYFLANLDCLPFLEEWANLCTNQMIISDFKLYAPFHEETLANAILWKNEYNESLPLIYTNASLDVLENIDKYEYDKEHWEWFKLPKKDDLFFYHGEKRPDIMYKMISRLKGNKRVLFLAPHLSTGGMPAFLLKRIQEIKDHVEIYVVEYQCHSLDFVVQRNTIRQIVGSNFTTLYENKMELFDVIDSWKPDIIHLDEPAERYDRGMITKLYDTNRTYKIVETFHDVAFKPEEKIFQSEAYAFCTPYHMNKFTNLQGYRKVIEFPIEKKIDSIGYIKTRNVLGFNMDKKHVLNVGLWTSGKNQAEGIEIARKYPDMMFHFVGNQASNFKDYWEPLMKDLPENVTVWGERDDVSFFMKAADIFMFNSTWECNPLVLREAIGYSLPIIARNLPQYEDMFTKYLQPIDTDLNTIKSNYEPPTENTFRQDYIDFYNHVDIIPLQPQNVTIKQHYIVNPFLEIVGISNSNFKIEFYDEQGVCHYNSVIKTNQWVKLNRSYYTKWRSKVWQDDVLIHDYTLDYTGKTVFIYFDSESLGDTIAWMPYCLEFKKKHNCHVIVSTYKNFLFEKAYPELEFVAPGTSVNTYGEYIIGWRYNKDQEPELCNTIPLQKAATNILGLEYKEIRPRFAFTPTTIEDRYVTIATNSTTGCKFWTKEGWQEVINYLVSQGYKVVNVSKEKNPFDNCVQIEDTSMDNTINMIWNSKFFIGLSSGLSWLAWMMGKQVVMISNFTKSDHEFQSNCIRIIDETVCHGCWNNKNFKFDRGDWNWCPIWKGYDKQFECHNNITADKVITSIKPLVVL
jgi:autotransporter strand-loop-strand O-heptosyltransferase